MSVVASLDTLIAQANALEQQGRHLEAAALFQHILTRAENYFPAQYSLGLSLLRAGQLNDAIAAFHTALRLSPDNLAALADLGAALSMAGQHDQALPILQRALAQRPNDPSVLLNIGRVMRSLGRPDEARAYNRQALAIEADNVMALNNQGNLLLDVHRYEEALAHFNHILAIDPLFASALFNRAIAFAALNRPEAALNSYDQALAVRPHWPEAEQNRCLMLQSLRRYDDALAGFARILAQHPDHAPTYSNRGNMLRDMKRSEAALEDFARALAIDPHYAPALTNRAAALLDLHRYADAARGYEALLAVDPAFEYGPGYLAQAKLHACEWTGFIALRAEIAQRINAGQRAMHPFPLLALHDDPALHLRAARIFGADHFPAAPTPIWQGERYKHKKIRLGYLSGDFYAHATAFLMAELFETHDRTRFDVTAFSFAPPATDAMQARLRPAFDYFFDVRAESDRAIATGIREREIDILIDLKGYTTDGRLGIMGHRPAPIQVSYLGYPGTTGAAFVDYLIADPIIIPPEAHPYYSEHIVTLPDTYQVNDRKRPIDPHTPSRATLGLPEQGFVFCCFNNNYKITPDMFDIWMRLLAQCPASVLWLLHDNDTAMHNLRHEAAARDINPDRLVFAPRVPLSQHLARHRAADLSLDILPYGAHTTASDALWAGLPIVTRIGQSFASRVAASLLHAVGLPDLITHSAAEYESLALRLAQNPTELAALKTRLTQNHRNAPLFDTARFRHHLESAYRTMWQRHLAGLPPAAFAVSAGK